MDDAPLDHRVTALEEQVGLLLQTLEAHQASIEELQGIINAAVAITEDKESPTVDHANS